MISKVKPRKFGENLLEKTAMIVNSRSRVVANGAPRHQDGCHQGESRHRGDGGELPFPPPPFFFSSLSPTTTHSTSPRSQKSEGGRICIDDMAFMDDVQVIEARKVQMEYFWKMESTRTFTRAKHVTIKSSRLDGWTPTDA